MTTDNQNSRFMRRTPMNIFNRLTTALLIALSTVLAGCVQIAPIPNAAHAGDTVVLGLGGINRNWGGEKPRNLQITITDSASQTLPVEIATIFQAYPDYRSATNVMAIEGSDDMDLQPFDGGWFVAVSLTNPAGPLNLAPGPATLHVAADNLTVARDGLGNTFAREGDLAHIPLDIVAGPPTPSDATTQFGAYDSRSSHFVVRPVGSPATTIGGVHYAIDYQSDEQFGALKPIAFPVSHNPYVKMDYKVQEHGDGSGTYHVYVYNPAGFTAAAPRQAKQAGLSDLGIYLEYFDMGSSAWMQTTFSIDTVDTYFIDLDGNRIEGLQAEMLNASQL
jgi:hypothetical protein